MLINELVEFGLNEKEAKAYLTLLEIEIATANELAKAAGLNRSSTYVTLELLKKKGLVSISNDKKIRQYVATPPEIILRTAKDKATTQENLVKKIEAIIPEMKALYKGTRRRPSVRVFEGKQGLIEVFEDSIKCKEKLLRVMSSPANLGKVIYEYIPELVHKRLASKVRMRGIHPRDALNMQLQQNTQNNLDEYTLIPKEKYKSSADLAIYDDKIVYMAGEDGGLAILIESKEMAKAMKNMFDLAFEEAKKLSRNYNSM